MDRTLLLAKLLDLHLGRTIERQRAMSKFTELADGIRGDLKNFDQQADELLARRESLRRRGEAVFAKHREKQDEVGKGLDALESAISDLDGSNSKNSEGSDSSSENFQGGSEKK